VCDVHLVAMKFLSISSENIFGSDELAISTAPAYPTIEEKYLCTGREVASLVP
jgi:hypothetical protein